MLDSRITSALEKMPSIAAMPMLKMGLRYQSDVIEH
jgi:hypothetical protein